MAVSTTTSKVSYTGNGVTTVFSVPFVFFETNNLRVTERVIATGVETVLVENTAYTVSGGDGAVGSVTALAAPASTKRWTIQRVLPRTQGLDLTPNDPFPADSVEQTLDRAVMLIQELEETLNRSLKYPVTDATSLVVDLPSSVERAGLYLAFGSDGSLTLTAGTSSDIVASAFMETVLAALDAAAAQAALGLGTSAVLDTGVAAGTVPLSETVFGKQTIWIPATAMITATTNGPATGSVEQTTNKNMTRTLDFDATTSEIAQFFVAFPKSWNLGTITFIPYWTAASGSGTVVWALNGVAISNDDPLDVAFGTAQSSADTLITAYDNHVGPESAAITIAGTPADGDLVNFKLVRDISDTLGVDAKLIGIKLFFTTNTGVDS